MDYGSMSREELLEQPVCCIMSDEDLLFLSALQSEKYRPLILNALYEKEDAAYV